MILTIFPLNTLNLVFIMIEDDILQTTSRITYDYMTYNVPTVVFILNRPVGSATPTIGIRAIEFFNPGVVPIIQ